MKKIDEYIDVNRDILIDEIRQEVLSDPLIKDIVRNNPVSNSELEELYRYYREIKRCIKCKSLDNCTQEMKGFKPYIDTTYYINTLYSKCEYKMQLDVFDRYQENIKTIHLPKKILNASFDNLNFSEERNGIVNYATSFISQYSKNNPIKAMYIHGLFGTGKTYIMSAIGNELAKKGLQTLIVYFPDLARELKSSIKDGSLETKVEQLKKADVLMLDDIGGEFNSAWLRDEILGPILQYRVLEELPTFFTSNYGPKELREFLSSSGQNKTDLVKAARIVERILALCETFELTGKRIRK